MDRLETMQACYQIPGHMWPTELGWLYDELGNSASHVEVGTYCGRSLLATCAGMGKGQVISVDNHYGLPNTEWVESVLAATLKLAPTDVSIEIQRMHSIDAARLFYQRSMKFDSVFLDACHEYAECKADIEAWRLLLNPGGLLCGHDYWPVHVGVMDAVNESLSGSFKIFEGSRIWYTRV